MTPKKTAFVTDMSQYHTPVLLESSVGLLDIRPDGTYVDLTFGGGGHSRRILEALGPEGRLYSFDQDSDTRGNCPDDPRFHYVESNFRFLRGALRLRGITEVDGILADLGVSSHHFDVVERGFSFRGEAPLDMRMNRRGRLTAADIVNNSPSEELTRILRDWGEIETPWKVANCLVRARETERIATTAQLVAAVKPCTPKKDESKFLTKLFQALRIEVNGEMEALKMALEQSLKILRPGGRLVVISYHSLEDRLVKNFLRSGNFAGEIAKDFFGRIEVPFEPVTRKAVVPDADELERNPRSRSARYGLPRKSSAETFLNATRTMYDDHEFDPITPDEEAQRQQDEEFARRVRREIRRVERGEADDEIRADETREAEEEAQRQQALRKERRRHASTFWQLFSGTILVREGMSHSYPYLLAIAGMFLVSISVVFMALHTDMKYMRLEREVQVLRERSIRWQERRFRCTTHSAVTDELRRRGIELYDPVAPSEVIDRR